MAQLIAGQELFHVGERVPFRGRYVLIDQQGRKQDLKITLKAGEIFPAQMYGDDLFYALDIEEDATSTDNEIPIEKAQD